jgi:hypothetical protein
MLIDPEKIIIQYQPGMAIYTRVYRPEPHTDFLIREESSIIKKLKNPIITIRPGLFIQNGVALVVIMFQIGSHPNQIFETWWNYHQTGDGKKYFEDMATQDNTAFHLYGDSRQVEKSIQIPNSLKDFFKESIEEIKKLPPWNMQNFDKERETIYQQHPTPSGLWLALLMNTK